MSGGGFTALCTADATWRTQGGTKPTLPEVWNRSVNRFGNGNPTSPKCTNRLGQWNLASNGIGLDFIWEHLVARKACTFNEFIWKMWRYMNHLKYRMFAEFNRQLVTSLLRTRLMWMHFMLALHHDCSKIVANQLFTLPQFIMVHCKICSSKMFRFGSLGKVASEVWGGVPWELQYVVAGQGAESHQGILWTSVKGFLT